MVSLLQCYFSRVPFGTCICSNCWDQFIKLSWLSRLFTSNIPRYLPEFASIFALRMYTNVLFLYTGELISFSRLIFYSEAVLAKDYFPYRTIGLEWEGWALVNWINHTIGVTAVTPTDRPKSVCNRCVINVFGGIFYVVALLFVFFCGCRGFCHRTESDLFLFSLEIFLTLYLLGRIKRNQAAVFWCEWIIIKHFQQNLTI